MGASHVPRPLLVPFFDHLQGTKVPHKKTGTNKDLGMRLHGHCKLADLQKGMVG